MDTQKVKDQAKIKAFDEILKWYHKRDNVMTDHALLTLAYKTYVKEACLQCCDCQHFSCGDEETYDLCKLLREPTNLTCKACDLYEERKYE